MEKEFFYSVQMKRGDSSGNIIAESVYSDVIRIDAQNYTRAFASLRRYLKEKFNSNGDTAIHITDFRPLPPIDNETWM